MSSVFFLHISEISYFAVNSFNFCDPIGYVASLLYKAEGMLEGWYQSHEKEFSSGTLGKI